MLTDLSLHILKSMVKLGRAGQEQAAGCVEQNGQPVSVN